MKEKIILTPEQTDALNRMGVIKGIFTAKPNYELLNFVDRRVLPLINEAVAFYKNTKLRAFYINIGENNPPELEAIKTSLKNTWKQRPKSARTTRTLLINEAKIYIDTPLKDLLKSNMQKLLENLNVKYLKKDNKPILRRRLMKVARYKGKNNGNSTT